MALPHNIKNGDTPDADILMANFNYLDVGGIAFKSGTYEELKGYAAANPAKCFDCWAADLKQRMFYCGDPTQGDGGFIVLGGAATSTEEVG
ncbi:MAG: hypothetical protein WC421_01600 [Elusimicrobiales bacterium]